MDDQEFQPIAAQVRGLIASSKNLPSSVRAQSGTDPAEAVARARTMFGCYRRDDAADPETYAAAVSAVLASYSPDIVQRVTDPRTGIPSRLNWLPSVKEVREACEELAQRESRLAEMEKRALEQIEARKHEFEARKARPTLSELKERYGENWGLRSPGPVKEEIKSQRREQLQAANRRTFAMECRAAGFPEDSPISPSLAALIKS